MQSYVTSRENIGGDQVARLRFCTSWSPRLATGDGATRTRAIVGATSYYHYGTIHTWFCCWCCLLLAVMGGAWCMARLIWSSIAALPKASRCNTAVVHARPVLVPEPRGTREYERKQPRRPSGAHSVAMLCTSWTLVRGDINVLPVCAVLVLCMGSLRHDARGFMYQVHFLWLHLGSFAFQINCKIIFTLIWKLFCPKMKKKKSMYYRAAWKVESHPFNRSYSQLMFFNFL